MKEKNQNLPVEGESIAPTTPVFPSKKLLISLLCVFIALTLLCGTLAVFTFVDFSDDGSTGSTGGNTSTSYDFGAINIDDYVSNFTAALVASSVAIPGYEYRVDAVTDETVRRAIDRVLLSNATTVGLGMNKTAPIDYADEVYLYIVAAFVGSTPIENDYFENAYQSGGSLQIGMEVFGPDFDAKLTGKTPEELGSVEFETLRALKEDDVILLTYTVKESIPATEEGKDPTEKEHGSYEGKRFDLAEQDAAFRDAILNGYGAVGNRFSFEYEEDIDGDGDKEKVTYEAVVSAIVKEENTVDVTFRLPDDYFGRGADAELYALNGKDVTFRLLVDYSIPKDANTYATMTLADITNSIGFSPADVNAPIETIRENAIAFVKEEEEKAYPENVKEASLALILKRILQDAVFTSLPEEAVEEIATQQIQYINYMYSYYAESDASFNAAFADLNAFGAYTYGYSVSEYDTVEEYIRESLAPETVKNNMIATGVYTKFVNDETKLSAKMDEVIDELMIQYNSSDRDAVILSAGGERAVRQEAVIRLSQEYLIANNTIDWNASAED